MAVLFNNNATGRLAGAIDATQTTLSLESGQGARFPSPTGSDWFPLTLIKSDGSLEIVRCTGRSSDTLTIARGQEATSSTSFAVGTKVELRLTAAAITQIKADAFPTGGIIRWSGSIASIPSGWALCDGANGTPDLRDKFVPGAGGAYAVGDTGGAATVTLTEAQIPAHTHGGSTGSAGGHSHTTGTGGSHNHTGSASSAGTHTHAYGWRSGTSGSGNPDGVVTPWDTTLKPTLNTEPGEQNGTGVRNAGAHTHSLSINSDGSHTHTVSTVSDHAHTIPSSGGGESHENLPPYHALAYIMKL